MSLLALIEFLVYALCGLFDGMSILPSHATLGMVGWQSLALIKTFTPKGAPDLPGAPGTYFYQRRVGLTDIFVKPFINFKARSAAHNAAPVN